MPSVSLRGAPVFTRAAAALTRIRQHAGEQRHDPVLVHPAVSAALSQVSRERRSPVSSGTATWLTDAWMKAPWPGRPVVRPLISSSRWT